MGIDKKIKKLLNQAKGESNAGNEKAAEAFAAKAQELVIKFKIDEAKLEGLEVDDNANPIEEETIPPEFWGGIPEPEKVAQHIDELAGTIGQAFFCKTLVRLDCNLISFVGRRKDIRVAKAVFKECITIASTKCEGELSLVLLDEKLTDLYKINVGGKSIAEEFRFSFFTGFSRRIYSRFLMQRKRLELEAGDCQALVKSEKEVDDYIEREITVKDIEQKQKEVLLTNALLKGERYGEFANLNIKPDAEKRNELKGE